MPSFVGLGSLKHLTPGWLHYFSEAQLPLLSSMKTLLSCSIGEEICLMTRVGVSWMFFVLFFKTGISSLPQFFHYENSQICVKAERLGPSLPPKFNNLVVFYRICLILFHRFF